MSKRPLPWSGTDEREYDEDYSPYTRVRLIMQNGRYEDELDLLRLKTIELQARVTELDHEIDEIINLDMDDVVSLKQDVHFYYRQYRRARLDALELQEELLKSRTNGSDGTDEHKRSDELVALRAELGGLERQMNADVKDVGLEGIEEVESEVTDRTDFPENYTEGISNEMIEHKPSDEAILLQAELTELENQMNSDVSKIGSGRIEEEYNGSSDSRASDNNTLSTQSLPRLDDHSASVIQALAYPDDTPSFGWFSDAFDYLNIDLGSHYRTLLRHWIDHERKNQWKCPGDYREGFAKFRRPLLCNKWIRNRRYHRYQADVDKEGCSSQEFTIELWAWWISLQPKWRHLTEDGMLAPIKEFDDDLNSLGKHGKYGWVVLLACVKWWGIGLRQHCDNEDQRRRWDALVIDMTKVLDGLVTHN